MIKKRTILPVVLLAVIMIPALSVLCIEEAEASTDHLVMETSTLSTGHFDSRNSADITITISNNTEHAVTVDVWVTYQDADDQSLDRALGKDKIEIGSEEDGVAVISIGFDHQGTKHLRIHAKSDSVDFIGGVEGVAMHNFTVHVSQSIWSNAITYVAIVLVIVVIGVAIYLRQRSAPKAEPQMTFTELEEMRRSQRTGVEPSGSAARRSSRPSAERRRYEGDRRRRR